MKDKYSDIVNELSDRELLFHLYVTQILLLVISIIAGWFLFDTFEDFSKLFIWDDLNIFLIGGVAGVIVVLLDVFLMRILPQKYYDDGGLNNRIFRSPSVLHIAFITFIVAISEEVLFRGVIQTNYGLVVSSLIFALVHYRYLFNWFLFLNVVLLSFFIGFIYYFTGNLLVTIFMHFIIDFLLGVSIKYRTQYNR
ncbi:CPBP family intramembrane glutamic endopeptidase [Cytobacillus purgationiresistens]|uniref:Membrane protease YdiL (CAAX protease family) n=1 Tax=Cytobacillus purgationiresistens TaxID=863449 RepID=A0ABU0AM43_9BACI|nr:CPBP family intramembrane glutamic endopeptidase [Cytobacillus purgationiresistens]MDQ0271115.1 membrane protease YdiL (CAAX protease family) [Cytobacillus purgationiresistens]